MAKYHHGRVRSCVNPNRGTGIVHLSDRLRIERYGQRHWAIYLDGNLLAVTVYKKGALAVALMLLGKDPSFEKRASE